MDFYKHITLEPSVFENMFLSPPLPKRIPLNDFIRKSEGHDDYTVYYWESTNSTKDTPFIITQEQYKVLASKKLIKPKHE